MSLRFIADSGPKQSSKGTLSSLRTKKTSSPKTFGHSSEAHGRNPKKRAKQKRDIAIDIPPEKQTKERKEEFDFEDPKVIEGVLKPQKSLKGKEQKRAFFRSRVLILLLLQQLFYVFSWLVVRHFIEIPWIVIITCGFTSLFFIPLSLFMLNKFGSTYPINYVFIFVYNVFTLPSFFALTKSLSDRLILEFFVDYVVGILLLLLVSVLIPKGTGISTSLILIVLWIIGIDIYYYYSEHEDLSFYASLAASYIAFCCLVHIAWYTRHPPQKYNIYDYVPAFVNLNMLSVFKSIQEKHICLLIFLIFSVIGVLFIEKINLFVE